MTVAVGTGPVIIGAGPIGIEAVARVAAGARVELAPEAIDRIRDSRAVVDRLVSGDALIYGLNTGLGHMRNERVPLETLRDYQRMIVVSHAGAIGPALPSDVVRAAMAARLAGLAVGGAGVSLPAALGLAALLNARVHPIVPEHGSVGAADLMHLAAIAQVLIGLGQAEFDGERLPGGEALRRAGLEPVVLEPKDGLAMVSANAVSIAHGALVALRAGRAADLADLVLACSLDAMSANPSIVDSVVLAAKPVAGQLESGRRIAAFLSGSERATGGPGATVQDPLSFRVGPQVHGGYREFVDLLRRHVELELNASGDNPFVDVESGRMISNGNFHPFAMALAVDALRPAIAHVAQLSDRRLNHLFAQLVADPELFTDPTLLQGTTLSGLLMRYVGAARTAELRSLAGPATLDVGPLDLGVEDHATNATVAVTQTARALEVLDDVLAIELLLARGVLRRGAAGGRSGTGVSAAIDAADAALDALPPGAPAAAVHAATRAAMRDALVAAERASGLLRDRPDAPDEAPAT